MTGLNTRLQQKESIMSSPVMSTTSLQKKNKQGNLSHIQSMYTVSLTLTKLNSINCELDINKLQL